MKDQNRLRRISMILLLVTLVMLIVHVQILVTFNRRVYNVHGNDTGSKSYMDINYRDNSTSSWLKRGFAMTDGSIVDLIGQTVDETLYNNSGDVIQEWGLRINITGDCFINQSWNGEVEIHQFVGTEQEKVQRLNLQDYQLEDVQLQYRYDGDLLIPLQAGDYLVYVPNTLYTEMPVRAGDSVKIGMIFYYLNQLDLSDYDLTVRYHRSFTQGWSFISFIVCAVLWFLATVVHVTSTVIYRNARKQMEQRRSGLNYMSELYEAIYIINLEDDKITPVSPGGYLENLREKCSGAKELLNIAVRGDSDEKYLADTLAFVDTVTLSERLRDRESVIWEFVSKLHGWCRFRFFAMDRTEGKPLENVIFAVEDINDERNETQSLARRLEKAEAATTASNSFLSMASGDLQAPVREIIEIDEKILRESGEEKIRAYAETLQRTANRMLTLINGLAHRAEAAAANGKPATGRYSLRQTAEEAIGMVRPMAEKKQLRLETEIAENLPDTLIGDEEKLKEITVSLLANAVNHSTDGSIRLSIFGKVLGESVHLLVSVRALPKDEVSFGELPDPKAVRVDNDLDLEVAGALLASLHSELKSVRSTDAWKDLYFETEQRIAEDNDK